MKIYNVKIRTITPYLQARFSENAQASLKIRAGKKMKIDDDESWREFLYEDKEKGIYVPSAQLRECLVNSGKKIKLKPYGNMSNIVQSYFNIEPFKIFLGKKKPDYINTSYPSRKADGLRVAVHHPAFKEGMVINFKLRISTDDVDDKTLRMILEKAGLEKGIGAWRTGGHGRFEVLEVKAA